MALSYTSGRYLSFACKAERAGRHTLARRFLFIATHKRWQRARMLLAAANGSGKAHQRSEAMRVLNRAASDMRAAYKAMKTA